MNVKNIYWGIIISLLIIIFDQITKIFFIHKDLQLIPNIFNFTYVENIGIAWSIPITGLILQVITLILIIAIIYVVFKYKIYQNTWNFVAVSMILGGAIGNAIDRFFRGFVIDFISVGTFPVFNVADSFVTIGVILILIKYLFSNKS